jgi:hypothetical protein
VKFLRTDEIEGNSMSTIHPPANGVSYNREEKAANTWPDVKQKFEPLTNKQLADLRAEAPQNPESYSAKAARARAEQTAHQQAHNDKLREAITAAERAKGRPLTFAERQLVLASFQ